MESRYHSTVVDRDSYLWTDCKYIGNNPVRMEIIKRPEDYLYSSAKAHILGKKDPLLEEPLFARSQQNEYRRFICSMEDEKITEVIRKQTRSGKPLGNQEFLNNLSKKLNGSLSFRPKGRPRKNIKDLRN